MRIVLVSTSYPISSDGSEAAGAFVADFAAELAKSHEVYVVAPGRDDSEDMENGVAVRRFSVPKLPLSLLNPAQPTQWAWIAQTLKRGRRTVFEKVAQTEADHLLALWALPSGWWCRSAGAHFGIPYSTWALGSDIWNLGRIPVVRGFLRRVLRDARHRFADGLVLADDVRRISGMDCSFLPSVRKLKTPPHRTYSQEPPYKLAFLGRWHTNKGIDILLEALETLSCDDWSRIAEVRICGGGPLEDLVRSSCALLRENGRPVEDGGFLNTDQATELYSWADYLLLPSRVESIPVVFSDAMQACCPLVSTTVGDLGRLLDKYSVGITVNDTTSSALIAGIRTALKSLPEQFAAGFAGANELFSVSGSVAVLMRTLGHGPDR